MAKKALKMNPAEELFNVPISGQLEVNPDGKIEEAKEIPADPEENERPQPSGEIEIEIVKRVIKGNVNDFLERLGGETKTKRLQLIVKPTVKTWLDFHKQETGQSVNDYIGQLIEQDIQRRAGK